MKQEVEYAAFLSQNLVCVRYTATPFFPWFKIRAGASTQTEKLKHRQEIQHGWAHTGQCRPRPSEGSIRADHWMIWYIRRRHHHNHEDINIADDHHKVIHRGFVISPSPPGNLKDPADNQASQNSTWPYDK